MSGTVASEPNFALPVAMAYDSLPGTLAFPTILNYFLSSKSAIFPPHWCRRFYTEKQGQATQFLLGAPAKVYAASRRVYFTFFLDLSVRNYEAMQLLETSR